jgi:hypothetical protein
MLCQDYVSFALCLVVRTVSDLKNIRCFGAILREAGCFSNVVLMVGIADIPKPLFENKRIVVDKGISVAGKYQSFSQVAYLHLQASIRVKCVCPYLESLGVNPSNLTAFSITASENLRRINL